MSEEILCMIPARGGSKRIERKNVREVAGKPLIAHSINAALNAGIFDKTIVSTEDEDIASIAEEHGAERPFARPTELASDTAQVVDVIDHTLKFYANRGDPFTHLAVLLPTTPLRTAEDLRIAYDRFRDHPDADFLVSVTDYSYSPFEALHEEDGRLKWYFDHEFRGDRSQDRPDLVVDNGSAYIMDIDSYRRERTVYGDGPIKYYMPPERSVDIDEPFDLELAEFLLQRQ